jgi:hypothetical protein
MVASLVKALKNRGFAGRPADEDYPLTNADYPWRLFAFEAIIPPATNRSSASIGANK